MNKNIIQYNDKGQQHGYWEWHWSNGDLQYKCIYNNGKEIGYEEDYRYNGKLIKKIFHL